MIAEKRKRRRLWKMREMERDYSQSQKESRDELKLLELIAIHFEGRRIDDMKFGQEQMVGFVELFQGQDGKFHLQSENSNGEQEIQDVECQGSGALIAESDEKDIARSLG